jgi:lysine 2,3-aminomutase
MVTEYDREHGISYWTKNYRTTIEADDPDVLTRRYAYYDPVDALPAAGRRWWAKQRATAAAG